MGKIRIKTLGDEEQEKEQKEKVEKRHEAKKTAKAPGMKGGERVVAVGPSEEELEALEQKEEVKVEVKKEKTKTKKDNKNPHSQKYSGMIAMVDRTKNYALEEALELLEKLQRGKFDETVELHVNTISPNVSGNVTLPHGTGKKTKVAVADDNLIAEIEKGKIDFDILVATPAMMAKLARVAKVLGPKGLMPNPKNGTISEKPEEVAKKYEGGQVNFKTEAKTPIIHLTVGKMSFGAKKLSENTQSLLSAIRKSNILNATLKSTMSPGIKLKI
jgi:large subunit ribosomal protein L1